MGVAGGGGALRGTWAQAGWAGTWLAHREPQRCPEVSEAWSHSHPPRPLRQTALAEKFQGHLRSPEKQSSAGFSPLRQQLPGSLGPPGRWQLLSRNPEIPLPLGRGIAAVGASGGSHCPLAMGTLSALQDDPLLLAAGQEPVQGRSARGVRFLITYLHLGEVQG